MESISLPRSGVGTFWSMMTMILVDEWMVIFFGLTEGKKGIWLLVLFYVLYFLGLLT
jgi:hypothetical protein